MSLTCKHGGTWRAAPFSLNLFLNSFYLVCNRRCNNCCNRNFNQIARNKWNYTKRHCCASPVPVE